MASIYALDRPWLHRYVPGARKEVVNAAEDGGRSVDVSINRDGYRGNELHAPGSRRRIVVYGDSFIAAEFSSLEHTFSARLEAKLGPAFEVVNAGVVGYGFDQVAVRMAAEMRDLGPELVIVAVFADNDLGDLVRNKLFRVGGDGKLCRNSFRISETLRREFLVAQRAPYVKKLLAKAVAGVKSGDPATPEAQLSTLLTQCRDEYSEFVTRGDDEVRLLLRDHYDADVSLEPSSESARYKLSLGELVLGRIRETAAEHATRLLLIVIPSRFDAVDDDPMGLAARKGFEHYRPTALSQAIIAMAGRQAIECEDLFPVLSSKRGLYFVGDEHWNDAGQEVASEVVAARVARMLDRR